MDSVLKKLSSIVGDETEGGEVSLSAETVADDVAGWDSVAHSRIMLRIEEDFKIEIEPERMFSFENVGELVEYVTRLSLGQATSIDRAALPPVEIVTPASAQEDELIQEAGPSASRDPILNLFSPTRYPAPYSMFHDRPGKIIGRTPDVFGFNNKEPPLTPKGPGEIRIFVFGNSTIRGGDIVDGMRLEAERLRLFDAKIYNFGMISANANQALMYLVFQGVNLEPDVIVGFDGYSDIGGQPLGYDPRPGYPYNQYMNEVIHEAIVSDRLASFSFSREERKRRDELRSEVGWRTSDWREALVAAYLDSVQKLHEISHAYGIVPVSILQPTLAFKSKLAGRELVRAPRDLVAHVRQTYTMAQEGLSEMSIALEGTSSRFEDLSKMFQHEEEQCFTDMVHLVKPRYDQVGRTMMGLVAAQMAASGVGQNG